MRPPLLPFVVLGGALLSGCSTTFTPSGRHLAIVVDNGAMAYSRDGRTYSSGFLGSGLAEAVSGVPAAEEAAAAYQKDLLGGVIASVVASACLTTALAAGFSTIDDRSNDHPTANALALGGFACGLVGLGVGLGFIAAAPAHHYDAINLYNDAVDRQLEAPKAPPVLTGPPPPPDGGWSKINP